MTERERSAPGWASFFTSVTRYRAFIDAVEAELRSRGFPVRIDDDAGVAVVSDTPGGFGLENLAQRCNAEVESCWDVIIKSHVNQILRGEADLGALLRNDFDKVKFLLRVRLYDPSFSPPGMLVGHPIADDLFGALVYDLPTAVSPVPSTDVRGWGKTIEELLGIGLSNVRNAGRLDVHPLDTGGVRITRLGGSSFFAATHILFANEYVVPNPKYGLLAACPRRDMVLIHAIGAGSPIVAMEKMTNAIHAAHHEGPGSLTRSLYWIRDGAFERVAIERVEGEVQLRPSAAFGTLLDELACAEAAPSEELPRAAATGERAHEEPAPDEDVDPGVVADSRARIEALLAEALPIVGLRTALTANVDVQMTVSREGLVCPVKLFVNAGPDASRMTALFDHPSFVMFPRRTMGDPARCEAALRSALQRIAIEIGLAKVPLPRFDESEDLFSTILPFSILSPDLELAAQDAAIKAKIKTAFTTVKL